MNCQLSKLQLKILCDSLLEAYQMKMLLSGYNMNCPVANANEQNICITGQAKTLVVNVFRREMFDSCLLRNMSQYGLYSYGNHT